IRRETRRLLDLALEEGIRAEGPDAVLGAEHLFLGRLRMLLDAAEARLSDQAREVRRMTEELERARAEVADAAQHRREETATRGIELPEDTVPPDVEAPGDDAEGGRSEGDPRPAT